MEKLELLTPNKGSIFGESEEVATVTMCETQSCNFTLRSATDSSSFTKECLVSSLRFGTSFSSEALSSCHFAALLLNKLKYSLMLLVASFATLWRSSLKVLLALTTPSVSAQIGNKSFLRRTTVYSSNTLMSSKKKGRASIAQLRMSSRQRFLKSRSLSSSRIRRFSLIDRKAAIASASVNKALMPISRLNMSMRVLYQRLAKETIGQARFEVFYNSG